MFYPYNSPIVMTDAIFTAFGGITGSSVAAQRTAAYRIAEMFMSEDLETYLTPTIVTGTYNFDDRLVLDHAYVNYVSLLRFFDLEERLYWTVSGTANVYASLRDTGEYGIVDLHQVLMNCQGCWAAHGILPYKIQVVYNTGMSSGTSYQSNILLGLTTIAQIMVNEIIGFGNEAPGDIGVQSFSNQGYSERRVGLLRTIYGSSAKANFVHNLLSPIRPYRYVGL